MIRSSPTPAAALMALLRRYEPLRDDLEPELAAICGPARTFSAAGCIHQAGDFSPMLIVLSGWVAEERSLADGRRQIVRLHLPGDLTGHCGAQSTARSDLVALTEAQVADCSGLRSLIAGKHVMSPVVSALRHLTEAGEEAALRHVVRLGRMTARERTAHVLLELYERLTRVDLVHGRAMPMPLTQEQTADYLGLSVVHVNRTLQQLRRDRLIETHHRSVTVLDMRQLAGVCGYPLAPVKLRAGAAQALSA